jgi:hypothetical protein
MTSLRQIEANRRNALKSTGPNSEAGKRRSRRNALRHGLTAEAVISALEDPIDYKAFEMSVTADFDAQTAVERELVLRLANLLWRLRRAVATETGLLDIQSVITREAKPKHAEERQVAEAAVDRGVQFVEVTPFTQPDASWGERLTGPASDLINDTRHNEMYFTAQSLPNTNAELAKCFLRLANFDNGTFERLSRYEIALWRQASQIILLLKFLRRQNQIGSRLLRNASN